MIFGEFKVKKQLPELANIGGTNFSSFIIYGYLNNKHVSLENLTQILDFGNNFINSGSFYIDCSFEEKNSEQKKSKFEQLSVGFTIGLKVIQYSPVGSKVSRDVDYRKEYYKKIIELTELPIKLIEIDNEFFLEHTQGGFIRSVVKNSKGRNPYDFTCELNDISNRDLINKIDLIVKKNSSDKPYLHNWRLSTSKKLTSQEVYDIYELIRNADLYADKYDVNYTCSIQEISGT